MNTSPDIFDTDPVLAWLDDNLHKLTDVWYTTILRGPAAEDNLKQRQQIFDNIADRVDFLVPA